ncbi:MAG: transposase family protein [Streptomycetales bacterium]
MGVAKSPVRTRGHTRMSSSPTSLAEASSTRHQRLLVVLATVPDPRDPRGVRYPLAGMLAIAITATLAGCRRSRPSASGRGRPRVNVSPRSG